MAGGFLTQRAPEDGEIAQAFLIALFRAENFPTRRCEDAEIAKALLVALFREIHVARESGTARSGTGVSPVRTGLRPMPLGDTISMTIELALQLDFAGG